MSRLHAGYFFRAQSQINAVHSASVLLLSYLATFYMNSAYVKIMPCFFVLIEVLLNYGVVDIFGHFWRPRLYYSLSLDATGLNVLGKIRPSKKLTVH